MARDLTVEVGAVALKNPLICGSGEHLIDEDGIRRALASGAGAVVAKSINESEAARDQLERADYVRLGADWKPVEWAASTPDDSHVFCRSGLSPLAFEEWLEVVARLDGQAASEDAFVVASLIPAAMEACLDMARQVEQAGIRILEVNVGAPHGEEAAAGAIMLERDNARLTEIVRQLRQAVSLPLWIKLTGQSQDVAGLAEAARQGGADAVTLMGRFMGFVPDLDTMEPVLGTFAGYGGRWALPITCRWIALARRRLGAEYPLLATNGARDGGDVARFMLAGATAVQMTSAVMTGGFGVVSSAIGDLSRYLESKSVDARDLVGAAADRVGSYQEQDARPGHWRDFGPAD